MTDRDDGDSSARLEKALSGGMGAGSFAGLAEAHRRAGRLADAERVAREGLERKPGCLEGGVVLSLTLLDQNRIAEARMELERMTAEIPAAPEPGVPAKPLGFGDELSDQELESAFESAETDRDQVVDADQIAQQAMRDADRALSQELAFEPDAAFATGTVAELLERQGDAEAASRVRDAAGISSRGAPHGGEERRDQRKRMIETLERWIENLRGEVG